MIRHLYVHLPFCAHRCGYCDFVTAVGRRDQHGAYVDALLAELALGVLSGDLVMLLGSVTLAIVSTVHVRPALVVRVVRLRGA